MARVSVIVEAVVIIVSFERGIGSIMQDVGSDESGFEAGINGSMESERLVDELKFSGARRARHFFVAMILQSSDKFFAGHVDCSFG